ncbi:MAG TPA: peroxidase-related enzyme [Thermoanaerobaculia bacterium]|nr:peroxidase-related enzyme [Thermoanaerobaculia bacterium]
MPHIELPEGVPGIVAGFAFRPETAEPMRQLAHILLHGPNTLTPAERELIATYVSTRNGCHFCATSHGAVAACHLSGNEERVEQVRKDFERADISEKLKALLAIAGKVQEDGKKVAAEDIERARQEGATDREIHDTVLIAAAFCMYNRYVDGLGTWQPQEAGFYSTVGRQIAEHGYLALGQGK